MCPRALFLQINQHLPFIPICLGLQITCIRSLMQTQLQIKYPPPHHQQVCNFAFILAFAIKSRSLCEVIHPNNHWKQCMCPEMYQYHISQLVCIANGMHHMIHTRFFKQCGHNQILYLKQS